MPTGYAPCLTWAYIRPFWAPSPLKIRSWSASSSAEFPGQIIVGIDARDGKVATRGWLKTSEVMAVDLAKQMRELGAAAIIYTDIKRDGTLKGRT